MRFKVAKVSESSVKVIHRCLAETYSSGLGHFKYCCRKGVKCLQQVKAKSEPVDILCAMSQKKKANNVIKL